MLSLLTVDFAKTFLGSGDPAAVGIVAQTSTINSAAEVIFALLMSFLAVRFKHKPLLLVGVVLVAISAVGNFFAPTLGFLQIFYAMEGVGTIVVAIMSFTMIGDLLPSDKKAKAVSYVVAMTSLALLVIGVYPQLHLHNTRLYYRDARSLFEKGSQVENWEKREGKGLLLLILLRKIRLLSAVSVTSLCVP